MTLTIYVLKNRLTGIFEKPFCENVEVKDYTELLTQSLAAAPVEALERHKEFDVYTVGTFDTKSGECQVVAPEFIVSLESICLSLITVKSEKKDGGKQVTA